MGVSLYDYSLRSGRTELLSQWDSKANSPLRPDTVTAGSSQRLSWVCEKGHRWQAEVYARTARSSGCPVCSGKKIVPGENDLKSRCPELAEQWIAEKNPGLSPENVSPNSHKKVWWRCPDCGHEWLAQIKSRAGAEKCGCPVCANRKIEQGVNDLATLYPHLAAQWHPSKNGGLKPNEVTPGKRRKVWWRCEKGHEWQALIQSRTRGSGCPVCAGKSIIANVNDLISAKPEVAAQWHPAKNGGLLPSAITAQSNKVVWWQCSLGHEWQAAVSARVAEDSGCPYCSNKKVLPGFNDLATLQPKIAAQWHPVLNGALTPEMVTCGSSKKVWWRCSEGHEWKAVIYSRAGSQRCGCPACAGRGGRKRQARYNSVISDAKRL